MLASNQNQLESTWATHHLMNDVNNFNLYNEDNDGSNQIQVENEAGLSIIKTESTILSSPSIPFVLNNVLLVLENQKNLISVQ